MFATIEAVLTIFLLSSFAMAAKMMAFIHSLPESTPARHVWETRFTFFSDIVMYLLFFPWIIFTVFFLIISFVHLGAWIFRKLTPEDKI